MKLAIVGSRTFTEYEAMVARVHQYRALWPDLTIVSGGAKGADAMGEHLAKQWNLPIIIHRPEWDKYGRSAGYRRNESIINDSDIVLAFFAPGPRSKGTQHSVDIALKQQKRVHIYHEGKWTRPTLERDWPREHRP
jgi:hypothetical protein